MCFFVIDEHEKEEGSLIYLILEKSPLIGVFIREGRKKQNPKFVKVNNTCVCSHGPHSVQITLAAL